MDDFGRFSMQRVLERGTEESRVYLTSDLRGKNVAKFLSDRFLRPEANVRVLDIGCGSGVLSFSLAKTFPNSVGGDLEPDNIKLTSIGRRERALSNLHLLRMNGRQLPFQSESFDGVVVNGVFEWAGANTEGLDPTLLQGKFLKEVYRVLRPNGVLYLAIENRLSPSHIKSDPHVCRPLLCVLPRSLASWISRYWYGAPYQAYIYSYWQMKKLFANIGFVNTRVFAPIPSYQYPFEFVDLDRRESSLRELEAVNIQELQAVATEALLPDDMSKLIAKLHKRAKMGMLKVTSCDFAFLARRPT